MKNNKTNETILRKTFRLSVIEGSMAQIYASLAGPGSMFLTKFAVLLGATPVHFGILSAIGQLSQIFQPMGAIFTRHATSRKNMVIFFAALGRGLTFLYGLFAIFLAPDVAIWVFLFFFLASTTLQAIGGNAWIAWISDIVPLKIRGRFFSWRTRYLMVAGLVTGYVLGGFIDLFDTEPGKLVRYLKQWFFPQSFFSPENLIAGFTSLFVLATLIGLIGLKWLHRQPELPKPVENVGLKEMLFSPFQDRNFVLLIVYGSWWMLSIGVGGPFWQPFMIRYLKMSLVDMQIYGMISTFAALSVLKLWGTIIDRVGNRTAMRIAILMSGTNALIWVFAKPEFYWIVYLEAVGSGIMWAGAGIIAMNFVLTIAPEDKRQVYSGLFGAFSGAAMMLTLLLSGFFIPPPLRITGLSFESEQVLFALSGIFRWSTLIPLAWIREPHSSSMKLAFEYIFHMAKVRVVQLATRVVGKH